jgi:hypothetical protein
VYVGSHNLSTVAWGKREADLFVVASWELGVMLVPPEQTKFPVPYDVMSEPFGAGDVPFGCTGGSGTRGGADVSGGSGRTSVAGERALRRAGVAADEFAELDKAVERQMERRRVEASAAAAVARRTRWRARNAEWVRVCENFSGVAVARFL